MPLKEVTELALDALVEPLGREYHYRIGGPDSRNAISPEGLELALTAVAGAFVLAYLKRLGEKAADETWKRIRGPRPDEPTSAEALIRDASIVQHDAALEAALQAAREKLREMNFSDDAQNRALKSLTDVLRALRNDSTAP